MSRKLTRYRSHNGWFKKAKDWKYRFVQAFLIVTLGVLSWILAIGIVHGSSGPAPEPAPVQAQAASAASPSETWVMASTGTWVSVDPSLEAKLRVEYPDGIQWIVTVSSTSSRPYMGHLGYDITRYATDPKHEQKISEILNRMPGIRTAAEAEAYVRSRFPKSPVTGYMVADAGQKYGVPLPLILAIMEQDSSMGTMGLGAKTRNPGNVANTDSGNVHYYKTWSEGVMAVSKWLSNHKMGAAVLASTQNN